MPEGPEIRRVAVAMHKHIAGRQIDSIYFAMDSLKQWQRRLIGASVVKVDSHGKALLTRVVLRR